MKKKETDNELDVLLPESDVIINGQTIEIKPFPFAKLPKVINILSKMGAGIYSIFVNNGLTFKENGDVVIDQAFVENISTVVEEHFPEVIELIAIYTGKTSAFYLEEENFSVEDGLLLLAGIIERNYDFFTKRLASTVAKIKVKMK